MDYYNCELPSTDYVNLSETEWNLPRLMQPPPRKALTSAYGNNVLYFPGYSSNIYPCRSKRHKEFHPFQNNQILKNEIIPRKSYPSHDWNIPMKNIPNHANRYNATMLPRGCSPYNLRSRFNSPYTQSSGDEFHLQKYPNELIFPKNPAHMQNIMHWELEYPEMQNFGNFNAPQDLWDNNIVQTSSDQSCNRKIPLSRSLLQGSRPVGSVCKEVIHPENKDKEILCITYPQQNLDSTEPVRSSSPHDIKTISVNNSLNTINLTENANSSLDNIHDQNTTEHDVHLKTPENSLDLMDENALSVYFLNDFCVNSQIDDKIFDLSSDNQNISSDNSTYNMFEEITVNSLEHENFFDEVKDLELEITSANEELGNVTETNLLKNFDEKSVAEIGNTRFKESINRVNEESSGYLTDNTHENCYGSKQNDNLHASTQPFKEIKKSGNINASLTENLTKESGDINVRLTENLSANIPTDVEDFPFKGNKDISGLKVSKALDSSHKNCLQRKQNKKGNLRIPTKKIKNKTKIIKNKRNYIKRELGSNWKNLDDKTKKYTAEQRLIFHAPIININNQNQISTLFNEKKLSDMFDSKFYHKFGNDAMKLLRSVQNNTFVAQSSDGKFSEEDTCLSRENFRLFPNESNNNQMNSVILNPSLESKESTFMYSNDLETLPDPIETSLSSVTNYILDEPMNTPIKHCDTTCESGSIDYSLLINENLEDNSESVSKKREQKFTKRKMYNNEISLSSPLRSENCIDYCMTLPENIFQPDSLDYSSTVEHRKITLKDNLNHTKSKRRKITWKKWNHITKRLLRTKLRSIGFLTKFHNRKIKSAKDRKNMKAVNQNSNNLYKEAFSQTSETESNSLSGADVTKQDAQTQWDISDIKESHESSGHEKNSYAEKISGKDEILCNQEIIKCEKEGEFKSERNKYCWSLRPRKLESAVINVNSSLKGIRSETNIQNARHNSLDLLAKIRQNNNKKKSSKTENRSSPPKVDRVSEKQTKNSNFTNEKQNKKVQRCKRTTENLSQGNQRKFGKLKNNRMLANLGSNQRVSSAASYAVKTAKTSKPKKNTKKN